ncbi:MAG: exonuclease domain-containing protein [Candidatus Binatia bacterium]|nr:exonuclease domain-containing protein [Candidatus Binatia bacterium]
MNFVFYDLETTGIDPAFDQFLQLGAILTDENVIELDRFEIRCRLMPHIVPSPKALLVNHTTPAMLTDPSLPTYYEAVMQIRAKFMEWSPAVFLGYNSIHFDEHFLRQAFYQTLHPFYITNTNGNFRSDVMKIAVAASFFEPRSLIILRNEKGNQSFSLEDVTVSNGLPHPDAHDAMGDVQATLLLAKHIKGVAPNIWERMLILSQKKMAIEMIMKNKMVGLLERYYGKSTFRVVTFCGSNPKYDTENAVFDLSQNPDEFLALDFEELVELQKSKTAKVIRTVKANSLPSMMKMDEISKDILDEIPSLSVLEERAVQVRSDAAFHGRVAQSLSQKLEDKAPSLYVEEKIYSDFIKWPDQELMKEFHDADWGDRLGIGQRLSDPRLRELAKRLIFTEYPEVFPRGERHSLNEWRKDRLLRKEAPWMTIPTAIENIDDLAEEASADEKAFLQDAKEYIQGMSL